MRDYLKEFSGDVIGDFLVDNDISQILKEATKGANAPVDDGPPTFYNSLGQYKKETKDWIQQLQNDLNGRVGILEKWRWLIIGGSIVMGFIIQKMPI